MDLEAIKAAVKANPSLGKEILVWSTGTDDGKQLLTNYSKAEVKKAIDETTDKTYTGIDNDLFEILGERKGHNERTYDYVKKIAGEFKALKAKADKLNENDEVKTLKATIEKMKTDGTSNDHWKGVYDAAVIKWEQEKKEAGEALVAKAKEYEEAEIERGLREALPTKFKDLPQVAIDAVINLEMVKIKKGAKKIDGKTVYHKEDGTPLLNSSYTPITSKEIWEDVLAEIIDKSDGDNGGGANPVIKGGKIIVTGEGDNAQTKLVLDKSTFSTKLEFNKRADQALRKQGIAVGSDNYKKVLDAAYKEYEVDKLQIQ